MPDAMSYLTNPQQAVSRYIDAHLRLMEIESHPEQLAYTPEGARDFMRLKRRIEAARRKQEALRLVLAQSEVTREQILGVYEKHGLPLPNNYQELDLDQLTRIARRDRNRLFEEISRLNVRLSHSPLTAEADLLRHELQEIRHSGMLRHGPQMPEFERQTQRFVPGMPSVSHQDEALDILIRRHLERIVRIADPAERALAVQKLKAEVGSGAWVRDLQAIDANLSRDAYQIRREFDEIRRVEIQENLMMDRIRSRSTSRYPDSYEEIVGSVARFRSEAPALDHLTVAPEGLEGQILYRRGGRGTWEPLEVVSVSPGRAGQPATVQVRPFALSLRDGDTRLYLRTSPRELVSWYESHAVSDALQRGVSRQEVQRQIRSPYTAGISVDESIVMRMQDAVERAAEFAEKRQREQFSDLLARRIISDIGRGPERLIKPSELLEDLLMSDKYVVSAARIGGSEHGRVPWVLAEHLSANYPNFLYASNLEDHIDDLVQETWLAMLEDRSWQRDLPVKASELMKYTEKFSRALDRAIHRSSKSVLSSLFDIPITAMDPLAAAMTQVRRAFEEKGIAPTEENLMAFVRTLRELEEPPSSLWPLLEAPLDTKAIQTWRMIADGRTRSATSYDALLTERLLLEERVDQELRSGMDVAASESAQVELDRSRLDPLETPISERLGISESPIDRSAYPDLEFPTRAQQMLLQRADEIERGQLLNLMRALEETQNIEHLTDTEFFDLLDDFSKRLLGRSLTDREMRRIHEKGWRELLEIARRSRTKRLYQLYSLEQLADMERMGLLQAGELFIEHQGRTVAARLERLPELGDTGYQVVIPSTGARVRLVPEGSGMSAYSIPVDELKSFEVGRHPLHGAGHPMTGMPGPVASRPPLSPRLTRPLGYGVGEVLHAADIMQQAPGLFGAIDIETTGLPEHYEALNMRRYFHPTEIGIATYSTDTGALVSQSRMVIRPTQDIEAHVRRLAKMTPEEFIAQQTAALGPGVEEAARQVYHQSLRSYAALADTKFLDPSGTYDLAELQSTALRGLEVAKAGLEDPELGQIPSVTTQEARRRFRSVVDELADAAAERGLGRKANIVAANAARAEAQWLPRFIGGGDWVRRVQWHDPQPIYRMLHPEDRRYSLGHIASQLGIEHDAAQLHSALSDAKLTAQVYQRLMGDQQLRTVLDSLKTSEYPFIEPGTILHRTSGGGRGLWRVMEVLPGSDTMESRVVLQRLLGRPDRMVIAGANWGDVEQRMYGRYEPVALDRAAGIELMLQEHDGRGVRVTTSAKEAARLIEIERAYWADRARRDIQAGFSDPSSTIFQMLSRPVSERREILQGLEAPRYASARGRQAYLRTIEGFVTGMESQLHHSYFRQVRELMDAGLVDHAEAGALLKSYQTGLKGLLPPMRKAARHEAALSFDFPEIGPRRIPVGSYEATHRAVVSTVHSMAERMATHVPASEYFSLAVGEFRGALGSLASEGASLEDMASAIYQEGQRRWRAGELLVQDISVGFLPDDQRRAAAVQSIRDLQRMLLQKPTAPLRRLHMSPFRDSPFIGGLPAEEAFAIAEGLASPIGAGSRGEAVRMRRQLWRQIADTAFRDSDNDATRAAREFLGLGAGDWGNVRLPFEVDGQLGMRLNELTSSQRAALREKVRSGSTFPMHDRMYSIIRRYLAETRAPRQATQDAARSAASAAIASARTPRGAMWAGLAGAGALGLLALGASTAGRARRRAEDSAQLRPGTGQIGLDIEISGVRRGSSPSPNELVHAAVMGIQQQSTVPLDVNVHQVDDTRTVNRQWAQELMLQALQG